MFALLLTAVAGASDRPDHPLPFAGSFQSLASEARERTLQDRRSWTAIPQNVYLNLIKDQDIVELQLRIEVLDDNGRVLYPIHNRMWLRSVGGDRLEIYKLSKATGAFEKLGEGACAPTSCSFQYVALARNSDNPYRQRYTSTISWEPGDSGKVFNQSGSLAMETSEGAGEQSSWFVFKAWTNQFEAVTEP